MGRKKKSPQKANDAENKRYPLRSKIDDAKGLEQKTSKVTTSSVTVAAKDSAQKKGLSATTLNTVTPAGPARNIRSDTSLVSKDTTCPVDTPATTNDARTALENTVASVVTRIAEQTVENREIRKAADIINAKMDTVIHRMTRESIELQEKKNEVENIKKELEKQREDFNEMKSTLADLGLILKRAVELLELKEHNATMAASVLEMSTVESENIFVDSNNEEMNGSVLEEGSLASLLCDSIRRRGSSLATSRFSDFTGESPASGRLTVGNGEVSEQMTAETRARRSSMDLAQYILEKRISTRLTNDDSVVVQNTIPAIRNPKSRVSVICLGTPYRPTPPLIHLVTSNNEVTPSTTTRLRSHSSVMFDDSLNLPSARDALRRTNNGTAPRDTPNTTMLSEDPNTSAIVIFERVKKYTNTQQTKYSK